MNFQAKILDYKNKASIPLLNDINITLVALFSSLTYFLQSLRSIINVKPLSYILPFRNINNTLRELFKNI